MSKVKILLCLQFILFFTLPVSAQVDTAWVRYYNGPGNSSDEARALAVDDSGNVYVTGNSGTIKYSGSGDSVWFGQYGGNDVAIDESGNVYVTGTSANDYATTKYAPSGETLWVRYYNGAGNGDDRVSALAVDGSGNVYVTGSSYGSGTFNDYATIKYTPNGDTFWVRRYNGLGNYNDEAFALALDGSGNVYVAGSSYGSGTINDYATIKYTPNGDTVWVRRYNGLENSDDVARALAVDASGNVYVTGYSFGSGTYYDYATIKYASDVDSVWFKWFRTVAGGANVIVDSSKVTSSTRTGFYQRKIKVSDGSNNLGQYVAFITAFKNGKTVRVKTCNWQVLNFGLNKIQHAIAESSLVMSEISGLNGITPPSGSDYTSSRAGNLDRLDKNISAVDDNQWDNSSRTLTDTTNIGEKIANKSAEKVWSFANPITLADTIPKVFAVNAGGSNPDTVASHVWSWSTRTLTSGSGSGANQVTLTVKDASDSVTVLNGVQVQVLNQAQTSTEGLLTSNSLGQAIFALNNATYKVRLFKPGYVFVVPESVIVAGSTIQTFYGSVFNPGTPPSPALCRVYGYVKDINNLPVVGAKIEALTKTVPLRYQNILISPYYKTTTTDSNGYWFLDLYPNSILNPSNTKYQFTVTVTSGAILKLESSIPNQSSWELSF